MHSMGYIWHIDTRVKYVTLQKMYTTMLKFNIPRFLVYSISYLLWKIKSYTNTI